MASPKLPEQIRARAIKAGRAAKANAAPEDGARAYRSAYNTVRSNYLYAASPSFRRRNLEAAARWRERQAS